MYEISVSTTFAASHHLVGYNGECARDHGHNWKAEAVVAANGLDGVGIAIDFKAVKKTLEEITEPFDHRNLNDLPPFAQKNPTSENLAAWIYGELEKRLPSGVKPLRVRVWETEKYSVTYSQ
jgi:6-pyruvoyltetrahydropterin/6-carboxytetrahydropterin synthase